MSLTSYFMWGTMLHVLSVINVNRFFPLLGPCDQNHIFLDPFSSGDRWLTSNAFAIVLLLFACPLPASPGSLAL